MNAIYLNLFKSEPGSALLEDCKAGDESIELKLGEQDARVIQSLLSTESFLVSKALAALVLAGIQVSHRDSRRTVTAA